MEVLSQDFCEEVWLHLLVRFEKNLGIEITYFLELRKNPNIQYSLNLQRGNFRCRLKLADSNHNMADQKGSKSVRHSISTKL